MIQTLYPSSWACGRYLNIGTDENHIAFARADFGPLLTFFSVHVNITNYAVELEFLKLKQEPKFPTIRGLVLNFIDKADLKLILSDSNHKHKLTLYFENEVDFNIAIIKDNSIIL